ncbi:hypothetical protein TA3x_001638 [Tundrisphaera sp. TA3]|uniref:hypothetical protein n=1 Tax=Tundrisphaera sp. TA3 TaxID=3435775 RepID=UPI003EBAA1AA
MFEAVEIISNPLPEPAEVWFEPWGMPHPLAPGQSLRIVAVSAQPGKLEIVEDGSRIVVYAWPGSTMRVYCGERLVDDFSIEVPGLPPDQSSRSFVEGMFGGSGTQKI